MRGVESPVTVLVSRPVDGIRHSKIPTFPVLDTLTRHDNHVRTTANSLFQAFGHATAIFVTAGGGGAVISGSAAGFILDGLNGVAGVSG